MEQKIKGIQRKVKIIIGIIIFFAVIKILWSIWHYTNIQKLFFNINGQFDYSIFWTAIGAIGSVIAFVGVGITIIYTEHSRRKQNEFEFKKELVVNEQNEFKEEVKKELEILDPLNICQSFTVEVSKHDAALEKLHNYFYNINEINYKLFWYYDEKTFMNFPEANNFFVQLSEICNYAREKIKKYEEIAIIYDEEKLRGLLEQMEKIKELSPQEKQELNDLNQKELKGQIKTIENEKQIEELGKDIANYRNLKWPSIVSNAKRMVEERSKFIQENLEN